MTDQPITVYRATRSVRYGGNQRIESGELVLDPPEWVPERLEAHLERLDEAGRLPRATLRRLQYPQLRRIAADGDVQDVDGNSSPEDIIDAYALDEPADEESED